MSASPKKSSSEKAAGTNPSLYEASNAGSVIEVSSGLETDSNTSNKLLIRIQNMSSTANLGRPIDLKKVALKCRNTEYNPKRFAAVIMRLREPRATALIFASGKMVVTGVKSTHNAQLGCKKFAYILERIGFQPQEFIDFKVQNMVGTTDVGFPIRLEGLVYAHSAFASYEPELFPGLIYRMVSPRVVLLIFVSGKLVITGAKKETDLSLALTKLYPVLLQFRKTTTSAASLGGVAALPTGASTSDSVKESSLAGTSASATKSVDLVDTDRHMEEV